MGLSKVDILPSPRFQERLKWPLRWVWLWETDMTLCIALATALMLPSPKANSWPGGRHMDGLRFVYKGAAGKAAAAAAAKGQEGAKIIASSAFSSSQSSPVKMTLDEGAVVKFQGRFFQVLTEIGGAVSRRTTRGIARLVLLKKGERHDWLTFERRAIDASLPDFPSDKTPNVKKGSLVIVGGGGMPDEIIDAFIEDAGGPDAAIVYVPCSYEHSIASKPGFVRMLEAGGATNVTWIHTKDRKKADSDESILGPLRKVDGLWFGGGRQWNFVDSYLDTEAHNLMQDVLNRGGVIGGSSAGASIQAEVLARGNPLGNAEVVWQGYTRGLGFLPGVMVDQHFSQRGRQKQMPDLIKAFPKTLGIGIDESTAIHVKGSTAEVLGIGSVFFYDGSGRKTAEHRLSKGEKFNLNTRKPITPALLRN
jgi:cyanophycinase